MPKVITLSGFHYSKNLLSRKEGHRGWVNVGVVAQEISQDLGKFLKHFAPGFRDSIEEDDILVVGLSGPVEHRRVLVREQGRRIRRRRGCEPVPSKIELNF